MGPEATGLEAVTAKGRTHEDACGDRGPAHRALQAAAGPAGFLLRETETSEGAEQRRGPATVLRCSCRGTQASPERPLNPPGSSAQDCSRGGGQSRGGACGRGGGGVAGAEGAAGAEGVAGAERTWMRLMGNATEGSAVPTPRVSCGPSGLDLSSSHWTSSWIRQST